MKRGLLFTKLIFAFISLTFSYNGSQDGTLRTYNGIVRDYSLYIPSGYQAGQKMPMLVSFHPYGRYQWNAKSWRDTLQEFAERNQIILLCPDGGADGRTDQEDDLDFSLQLVTLVQQNYLIDRERVFVMGYSWGARAALKFGLSHPDLFSGLILAGMASDQAASEFAPFLSRARNKRIFLIHGEYDSPATRFQPLYDQLIRTGACVEANILPQSGHSFAFARREDILSNAWHWLQNSPCYQIPQPDASRKRMAHQPIITIYPNPGREHESLWVKGLSAEEVAQVRILDRSGIMLRVIKDFRPERPIEGLAKGDYYFVFFLSDNTKVTKQVLIR